MILPKIRKPRTSRRTSKRRQSLKRKSTSQYDSLERRNLLATFVVTNVDDVVDAEDGLLSLREAVIAANTNAAFSDAPAGDAEGDRIEFEVGPAGADPSDIQLLTEGELEITDDLVIVGRANEFSPETQIAANFNSRIFNVNTSEPVTFSKLGLTSGEEIRGGLIQVLPGGDVSILESVLSGGQARNGGAIRIASGDLFVYRSTIDGNAADNGGGIHATNSSIRFNDVTVTNNTAGSAGGAIDASRGTVAVYGSRFGLEDGESGNEATFGGAIYLRSDVELLSDSDFIGNLVSTGGGAISGTALSSINVFGGIFRGNGSRFLMEGNIGFGPGGGGAISSSGASIYVANASFTENIALNGGAIYSAVEGGRFRNLDISGNTATITGGGLRLEGTSYVFDTEITGNRSERTEDTSGGGVSVGAGDWAAVFRRVNISENFANSHGGGIAIEEGATARVFNSDVTRNRIGGFSGDGNGGGGGISNRGGDLLMTNARIIFNEATENSVGGGVVSTGGSLLAFDTVISSNSAERFGGGFYLAEGYARFADSAINLNQAREAGGGAFVESGKLVLVGGGVSTNEASALPSDTFEGYGGGVAVGVRGQLYARSEVKFTGNSADSSGGSISSNGLINIQNARVVSGTADNGGGIYLGVGARAYISNTNFDFNTSTINGSAIFGRADSILVFSDSLVRNNSVTDNADGAPILVSQSAFSRIESVLYRLNTPLNEPILDAVI